MRTPTWRSPTDSCSTPSAGRPSSTRRSWRAFSASRPTSASSNGRRRRKSIGSFPSGVALRAETRATAISRDSSDCYNNGQWQHFHRLRVRWCTGGRGSQKSVGERRTYGGGREGRERVVTVGRSLRPIVEGVANEASVKTRRIVCQSLRWARKNRQAGK